MRRIILIIFFICSSNVVHSSEWVLVQRIPVNFGKGTPTEVYKSIEMATPSPENGCGDILIYEEGFLKDVTSSQRPIFKKFLSNITSGIYSPSAKVFNIASCDEAAPKSSNDPYYGSQVLENIQLGRCIKQRLSKILAPLPKTVLTFQENLKRDAINIIKDAPKEECLWKYKSVDFETYERSSCDSHKSGKDDSEAFVCGVNVECDNDAVDKGGWDWDLALDLNKELRNNQKNPPVFFHSYPECGDGEISVKLKTDLPVTKLSIISENYFKVCKARGLDPWSSESCYGWLDVQPNFSLSIAGGYRYQAFQANGSSPITGHFDITGEMETKTLPIDKTE